MQQPTQINVIKPHAGQLKVVREKKRNNLLILPRRWGKTSFFIWLIVTFCAKGKKRVAYSAPTFKLMLQMWDDLINVLRPMIDPRLGGRSSKEERKIVLANGSIIELWSSDDPSSGRGRKYHFWLHDEAQRDRQLNKFIKGSVMPALIDYKGELWIGGTANGIGTELHDFFLECEKDPDNWQVARGKIQDNPRLDPDEIDQQYKNMGPTLAAQELESEWVRVDGIAPLVKLQQWKDLGYEEVPDIGRNLFGVMAFDGSITGDCTAISSALRIPSTDHFYTRFDDIHIFLPQDGIEGEINYAEVEATLWGLWQTGRFSLLVYDSYQAVAMMQRLRRRGVNAVQLNQGSERLKADSFFRQLLIEGRYHHPQHQELTEHCLAATVKYYNDDKIRIVKGAKKEKIDLSVTTAMACWAARNLSKAEAQSSNPVSGQQRADYRIPQITAKSPFTNIKDMSPWKKNH